MMKGPNQFRSLFEVLDPDTVNWLGRKPCKLYVSLINHFFLRDSWELRVVNKVAARRARISTAVLAECQQRLIDAGMLEIEQDTRPGFVFEAQCTTYRWPVHSRPQPAEQAA